MIRELILQLKLGSIAPAYFRDEVRRRRARPLPRRSIARRQSLAEPTTADLRGLLRVDV